MAANKNLFWDTDIIAEAKVEYTITKDGVNRLREVQNFLANLDHALQRVGGGGLMSICGDLNRIIYGGDFDGVELVPTITEEIK